MPSTYARVGKVQSGMLARKHNYRNSTKVLIDNRGIRVYIYGIGTMLPIPCYRYHNEWYLSEKKRSSSDTDSSDRVAVLLLPVGDSVR
jgi:hypothetical protein